MWGWYFLWGTCIEQCIFHYFVLAKMYGAAYNKKQLTSYAGLAQLLERFLAMEEARS